MRDGEDPSELWGYSVRAAISRAFWRGEVCPGDLQRELNDAWDLFQYRAIEHASAAGPDRPRSAT